MKVYGFMVRSGLSGITVHVDVYVTRGPGVGQHEVHLSTYGDTIGATQYVANRAYVPTVYLDDGSQVELPAAISRREAMRDIVQYLSDARDGALDLEWRESVAP